VKSELLISEPAVGGDDLGTVAGEMVWMCET